MLSLKVAIAERSHVDGGSGGDDDGGGGGGGVELRRRQGMQIVRSAVAVRVKDDDERIIRQKQPKK